MKTMTRVLTLGLLLASLALARVSWLHAASPIAVGQVAWGRDLAAALAQAKATRKPIFALFQEVPGCAGCEAFGRDVLSDPVMVKVIQESFVPLLIHNNAGGKDAEVLQRFNEPAWNYQVIRFLDAEGKDWIPRREGVWTIPALKERILSVLEKAGRPAPAEWRSPVRNGGGGERVTERVAFAQGCFWTGEMKLGALPGVVRTEAGFFAGNEVTVVDFDPAQTTLDQLVEAARRAGVATDVFATTPAQLAAAQRLGFPSARRLDASYATAPASDQKKQLQGTVFSALSLTPEQATKVNAFARTAPGEAMKWLTEAQRREIVGGK